MTGIGDHAFMSLRSTEGNPIPEGIISDFMTAKDGLSIRYARTTNHGAHGTVVLLQGRNESIEKYLETMVDLQAMGFSSVTFDWRGQGDSDRLLRNSTAGHIKSFDAYVRDLDQFFHDVVLPDCRPPYSILAHSMGGLVALLASPLLTNRIKRMVFLAPLIELNEHMPQERIRLISSVWCLLGLGARHLPGTRYRGQLRNFAGNQATHDQRRFARNLEIAETHPDLTVGGPSAAWVRAACEAMRQVSRPEFMAANRLPILFLAAGSDAVVSSSGIERYARRIRSGHCLTIDGARHELLQEADIYREQALAAFKAFVAGRKSDSSPDDAPMDEPSL
ncbi:lysophospholipase [Nitratireductor aestuarii]|uniref:Lysophospholipase n=1 Tax=Nitratireductor aestuarii TaxID=1735103 RepID=A0A916RNW5_9HYPH|nr:alpha/beta hydrolase [Nitratireductor aestuarii]GGA64300.1 lysophospholipase [Nitratireductor aestuarii]